MAFSNSRLPGTINNSRPAPAQAPVGSQKTMAQNINPSQQQQAGAQSFSTGSSSSLSSVTTTTLASTGSAASSNNSKPSDYVYFDRTTAGFSAEAVPKAKGAQVKLEHFYKVAVEAAIERNTRYVSPLVVVSFRS